MRLPTLHQFFRHQLNQGFASRGLAEPSTVDYISDVLARFAQTRALYAVAGTDGRPLEHIVDFLCAARDDGARPNDRARRRSVMCHLGEYTLFMSGLFRERLRRRGELKYYMEQGSTAYGECAGTEPQPGRRQLFQRIHRDFARIADTLDDMRRGQLGPSLPANAGNLVTALWRR
jgi:hypothetical protein